MRSAGREGRLAARRDAERAATRASSGEGIGRRNGPTAVSSAVGDEAIGGEASALGVAVRAHLRIGDRGLRLTDRAREGSATDRRAWLADEMDLAEVAIRQAPRHIATLACGGRGHRAGLRLRITFCQKRAFSQIGRPIWQHAHDVMKRIGILTGGGDVPGLNSVIKSVVYRSSEVGWEAIGIRAGWKGLTHLEAAQEDGGGYCGRSTGPAPGRSTAPAGPCSTPRARTPRPVPERAAGAGCPGAAGRDGGGEGATTSRRWCSSNLERLGIGALVAIGGDDTLSYAARLGREGFPVIAIPKTMDNDVHGHRVLHRLLDGRHPRQGAHQPSADDAGQPRTHRRLPHLRAQLRATPPGTRPTSRARAASSPRRRSTSTAWRTCSPRTGGSIPRTTRSSSPARAPCGPAASSARSARPTRTAIATRPTWARRSRTS